MGYNYDKNVEIDLRIVLTNFKLIAKALPVKIVLFPYENYSPGPKRSQAPGLV